MPNEESRPDGIDGVLQDGMSPEGSAEQAGHAGGSETHDAKEDERESSK